MHQSKTDTPADPDKKQYAWHRHPAFITILSTACTVAGGVLTVVLGQADVLPAAINPAPPQTTVLSTTTATATTTATVTETVTETPTPEPSNSTRPTTGPGVVDTVSAGVLSITIRIGSGGKIGPNEWRAGSAPGANADVLDSTGRQLNRGCYPTWVLKRDRTVVQQIRGTACEGNGFSMFSFGFDSLKTPGTYQLSVSVVTDSGAKGSSTATFTVT